MSGEPELKKTNKSHQHRVSLSVSIEQARDVLRYLQASYRNGSSPPKGVVALHGCISRAVAKWEANPPGSKRQPRSDEIAKARARLLRRGGYSYREIGREMGLHRETVRNWFRTGLQAHLEVSNER